MKEKITMLFVAFLSSLILSGENIYSKDSSPQDKNNLNEPVEDHKIIIYQIFTRLFGNKKSTNKIWGTIEENGVGKFNDITDTALQEIKKMGITHIWYTGVIEHATLTDYTKYGIPLDDADVVKGRAGSPYAIKDYYDVNPDLAEDVPNRLKEFQNLIERTHNNGLKVIMDFVPNHIARKYHSDAKPKGVKDFGEDDDTTKAFDPNNNFYYILNQPFVVPKGYEPLGKDGKHPTKDGKFDEFPAKATGDDKFTASPDIYSWFETVKLNYGVDIQNGRKTYFDPIPNTWYKMLDILTYWAKMNIDGFRCDMAEMVPVEFWGWVIPQIKQINPSIIFIAEIYNPSAYKRYIDEGKFDYLYDKCGLYDTLKPLLQGKGDASKIKLTITDSSIAGISSRMLRFLENHDEVRIASKYFAGDMWAGVPGMVVCSTISSGPVMIYFGQEVGEKYDGIKGFSGADGRTTIFDYWGLLEHQKWMNDGKFDGGKLSEEQKSLRKFYCSLFNLCLKNEAIRKGKFYDLYFANCNGQSKGWDDKKVYAYLRFTESTVQQSRILIIVNFHKTKEIKTFVKIPESAWNAMGLSIDKSYELVNLLYPSEKPIKFHSKDTLNREDSKSGIPITLKPMSAYIYDIK